MYPRYTQFCMLLLSVLTAQILINVILQNVDLDVVKSEILPRTLPSTALPVAEDLDEALVKDGIKQDLENEQVDDGYFSELQEDEAIKSVEDPDNWIYRLDFNLSHPFDNECRFPVIRHDDEQLSKNSLHYRETDCSRSLLEPPFVHQHRNGEILVARPNRATVKTFKCYYRALSGALRPKKGEAREVGNWTQLPQGKRILIQKDQFLVKCLNSSGATIFLNAFSWISDKPRLTPPLATGNKFSISLLVIDSTSRNQFFRHMPLTLEWIKQRDFQILQGYTKVGDNSAINLLSIFTGLVYDKDGRGFNGLVDDAEGELYPKQIQGDFGRVNTSLIHRARAAGCATLWNDEIANPNYGLFHYYDFKGFDRPISDYYYRPYYEYIYKKMNAGTGCRNGQQLLPKWLSLWEQFETKFARQCHFAFNFYTGLTHASAANLELYDVPVSDALTRMEAAGVLENTFLIIMGDHGQRISPIQKTSIGRIEERMSFFSVHVPERFKQLHPQKYQNLVKNRNRLTSNFDVHETLDEILSMTVEKTVPKLKKRGISLFEDIPRNRTCQEALIPENFCMCMDTVEPLDVSPPEMALKDTLTAYLDKTKGPCVAGLSFNFSSAFRWHAISQQARAGIRYKYQWEQLKNKDVVRDLFEIEFLVDLELTIKGLNGTEKAKLVTRVQYNKLTKNYQINAPPQLVSTKCPDVFILDAICGCY